VSADRDTPTTPCSVVWYDGHPWVLDGEPGIATPRRWVGMRRNGQVGWMGQKAMEQYRPAVIYRDAGEF
jgi:hypothetical protein